MSDALKPCAHCGQHIVELTRNDIIFMGQDYGSRYPTTVATQSHGFRVRCGECGCQTCWWHYEQEAVAAWNTRAPVPPRPSAKTLAATGVRYVDDGRYVTLNDYDIPIPLEPDIWTLPKLEAIVAHMRQRGQDKEGKE